MRTHGRFMNFGVAVLCVTAALALRVFWWPVLKSDSPFLFFFSALALASWFGGVWPGILATVLGACSAASLQLLPIRQGGNLVPSHLLQYCTFMATGVLISILMEKLHVAIERSLESEQEMEKRVRERTAELLQANRALMLEKNKLLGILDRMPEGVYIVNPQYEIEYANPAMEREFGKFGNHKCYEYLAGPDAVVCPWCKNPQVFDGKSFSTEWISPRNNKIYDCFEAPILLQNGTTGKLKILHDITEIKNAKDELSSRHRQIQRLSSELLNAQEKERLRVSKELHDELGQALTLIKLKIGLVDTGLDKEQGTLKKYCADASAHVDQAIEDMRRLSRDLSPVMVDTLGITIALRRLAEEFDSVGGIRIRADISAIDELLPKQSSIMLYRIFQEGLNNIVKHSAATAASIEIRKSDGAIHFELNDNGKGFERKKQDLDRQPPADGLGLPIMMERVRTLGGSLGIETRKGSGTRLYFSLPIQDKGTMRAVDAIP